MCDMPILGSPCVWWLVLCQVHSRLSLQVHLLTHFSMFYFYPKKAATSTPGAKPAFPSPQDRLQAMQNASHTHSSAEIPTVAYVASLADVVGLCELGCTALQDIECNTTPGATGSCVPYLCSENHSLGGSLDAEHTCASMCATKPPFSTPKQTAFWIFLL
jgi:hypothetical protein